MAKFYCQSGLVKVILTATDEQAVIRKLIKCLKITEIPFCLFVDISEMGFGKKDATFYSLVPFFKEVGINLPSDSCLIEDTCRILGTTHLSEGQIDWLFNGSGA